MNTVVLHCRAYIKISHRDMERDKSRYQTVYAAVPGSVAAPTAGLHFSEGCWKI